MTRALAENLDDPSRIFEIREKIQGKPALRSLYLEVYKKYSDVLARSPRHGLAVELGSGGGFVKDELPDVLTTDTIHYEGIDQVVDATKMPFETASVRAFLMMNVFHHIPDVEAFLHEAARCLLPGGRIYIFDQHPGWISKPILKYAHHEAFDDRVREWKFASTGPLSSANGALAWVVFQRDRQKFFEKFPQLKFERYEPHTPLRYWLTGGLKKWTLLPNAGFGVATALDSTLVKISKNSGSFVDIELVKRNSEEVEQG